MKKLFIIGCGNIGGFVANNLQEFVGEQYTIEGFFDDDVQKIGKEYFGYQVLGSIDRISQFTTEVSVVVCVANPIHRKGIVERLSTCTNIKFPSFISKHVWVSNKVTIGEGVIIYPGVAINYHTEISDFSIINMNCAIGHDCAISMYSTLAPNVSLAGFTYLEDCVEMCIGSATVQGIRVGENSVVGGMGMVTKNIPSNCTAVGVPAKVIKYHTDSVVAASA